MSDKKPYKGRPMSRAAKLIEGLYERRDNDEENGCAHGWSDLATWEIADDIIRELNGTNPD